VSEVTAQDVARVASSFARQELEVGVRLERERIIKLLEDEGSSTFSLAYLISLIKGDNK
jgi:hypothetical protein